MEKNTQRLFFALELDEITKEKVMDLIRLLKVDQTNSHLRWTPKHKLHITLRFMGDVPIGKESTYIETVKAIAQQIAPFNVKTTGFICLPDARHPRLLALGVEKSPALDTLFCDINQALVTAGLAKEKHGFAPHITLVRTKRYPAEIASLLKYQDKHTELMLSVNHITLFRTDQLGDPSGAKYTPLTKLPLLKK